MDMSERQENVSLHDTMPDVGKRCTLLAGMVSPSFSSCYFTKAFSAWAAVDFLIYKLIADYGVLSSDIHYWGAKIMDFNDGAGTLHGAVNHLMIFPGMFSRIISP